MTSTITHKIKRIISVVDTREYIYDEDLKKSVLIPDTGEINVCQRCGREHFIHATVEDESGELLILGIGCMKAADFFEESEYKKVKSIFSATETLKKREAELKSFKETTEVYLKAKTEIEALPTPDVIKRERVMWDGKIANVLVCDDAEIWLHSSDDDKERRAMAVYSWRRKRFIKQYGSKLWGHAPYMLVDYEKRVEKAKDKLKSLTTSEV